jgi:hypothetical protein
MMKLYNNSSIFHRSRDSSSHHSNSLFKQEPPTIKKYGVVSSSRASLHHGLSGGYMRSTNTSANKIVDSAEKSNSRNTPKRINFMGGTKTFTKIVKRDHLKSQIIFEEMKREPLKIAPS